MKRHDPTFYEVIFCSLIITLLVAHESYSQKKEQVISEKIIGHIFIPQKVEATQERVAQLQVPDGFTISKFAEGLGKPRIITVGPDGTVYISRRMPGDVLMLKDTDKDGVADEVKTIIKKKDAHGITIHDNKLYLVTVKEVYSANLNEDGTVGKPQLLIDDLPDGGQHPNRTIAFGSDSMMYITVGSTCNACGETNKESATVLRARPDGSNREIYATGLRNTIGFDWHPNTGELYGMDHGIDWLGDQEQKEELNHIKQGADYGWPYVYDNRKFNKADEPDSLTHKQYAAKSEEPLLLHTAHSAPMGMVFYESDMFPSEYRNDAFVTFRGSWNRKPAVGYKVSRVIFKNGKPARFEDFITGFLTDDGKAQFGRIVGVAVYTDGSLLITDDDNGVVYRIAYEGS